VPRYHVAVIDLGAGSDAERAARRDAIERGLGGGHRAVADPALRRALAGEPSAGDPEAGRRALAAGQAAFGELDCKRARPDIDRAVVALGAAQAAGVAVDDELRRAQTIRLVCSDQSLERGTAQSAAAALRRLGAGDPPPGVSSAVWARYPALDAATGVQIGRLDITTRPPGAVVWIDHERRGLTPLTASLPEGEHLVAAALPSGGATAQRVTVVPSWTPTRLALALEAGQPRWRAVEAQVRAWRRGAPDPAAAAIGELLARARLSHTIVIDASGALQVWSLPAGRREARQLGSAGDPAGALALLEAAAREPALDPQRPLLREERASEAKKSQQWWVYAAILGAVAVGAGVVISQELGDDRQRIEITLP
jgi:hypothetical protein